MATETDSERELSEAREAAGWPDGEAPPEPEQNGGRTAAERADNDEGLGEEDDGQLFVLEHGKRVSISGLYRRNTPVEYRLNLGSKSVKGSGQMGLVSFHNPDMLLLVPVRAGDVKISPTYDGDGNVKKVTIYAQMKPQTAYDAESPQAKSLLGIAEDPAD